MLNNLYESTFITGKSLAGIIFFRCVEGPDANYYGFVSCGDWALKEKCFLQQQLQELNRQEVCKFIKKYIKGVQESLLTYEFD